MSLPTDYKARKELPIATGVLDYFPKALAEVSKASLAGNRQHLAGQPLRWDRSKSSDEADALIRHFLERGTIDEDGVRHSAKMAWRALALLEKEIEAAECSPPATPDLALLSKTVEPGPVVPITPESGHIPAIPPPVEVDE